LNTNTDFSNELYVNLDSVLKQIKEQKLLPRKNRDYLYLYLRLEKILLQKDLSLSKSDVRENIKNKFNTGWFEPKLKALFNLQGADKVIFKYIYLQKFSAKLIENMGFQTVKKSYQEFYGVEPNENNIRAIFYRVEKLFFFSQESLEIANISINKICNNLYQKSIQVLGSSKTENIEVEAFEELNERYSLEVEFIQAIKDLPKEILIRERLKLLTKEELENVTKRLRKVDQIKTEFTNIAAHELKTPLVPMIGYLSMMKKDPIEYGLTPKAMEIINICLRNSRRLELLVQDILDISKLEAGEMKFEMKKFDITLMVKNVVQDFKIKAQNKKIGLDILLPKKKLIIIGDGKRLEQVVSNLVKNALKFSEKGVVKVNVYEGKKGVVVEVSDNGPGIPKKSINKIFTKFYQVQDAKTRKTKGTGLGLAICKEIVQAHGGEIKVESDGNGSVFSFFVPKGTNI
jgi:signal transduction histidine kinase